MFERAIKYREAFVNLEKFDRRNYKFLPTTEEWRRAEKICIFTDFCSNHSFDVMFKLPDFKLVFFQVWKIINWLQMNEESEYEIVILMVIPMKEKFDKY